jgi:hypothetical protein
VLQTGEVTLGNTRIHMKLWKWLELGYHIIQIPDEALGSAKGTKMFTQLDLRALHLPRKPDQEGG